MRSLTATSPSARARPRRSRLAVSLLFALMGITMGSWAARIPGVRAQVGVDDVQWGLIILAAPAGSLISMIVVTRLIGTVGADPDGAGPLKHRASRNIISASTAS